MHKDDIVVVKTLYGAPCGLAYSSGGEYLLVTENAGAVRLYKTQESDIESVLGFDDLIDVRCVVAHTNFTAISSDDRVFMLRLPDGEYMKLLTRHSLVVRQLAINYEGSYIATSSDDNLVRLINVNTITDIRELREFTAPVTGMSFDPLGNYLACVSCDGMFSVWQISSDTQPSKTHAKELCRKCDPEAVGTPSVAWQPTGRLIAVSGPSNGALYILYSQQYHLLFNKNPKKDIYLIDRFSYNTVGVLKFPLQGTVTSLSWSSNGLYLVSSSTNKQLMVWDVTDTRKAVLHKDTAFIANLVAWHPQGNMISYTTLDNTLETWQNVVPSTSASPVTTKSSSSTAILSSSSTLDLFADSSPVSTPSTQLKSNNHTKSTQMLIDDTVEESNDNDNESPDSTTKAYDKDKDIDDASDLDDFIVDDDAGDKTRGQQKAHFKQKMIRAGFNETTPIQAAFQPGATPLKGSRRYLAFNTIGVVHFITQDAMPVFYIEFHDRTFHRTIQFSDPHDFSFASLGPRGAAFVCMSDTSGLSAAILFKSFDSWTTHGDWTQLLLDGEDPLGLAVGNSHVILVTSLGFVRVFTVSGVQVDLFALDTHAFVAVCARGDLLMLVNHATIPLAGCQQLEITLYDLTRQKILYRIPLPLTQKAKLLWIGFSNNQMPLAFDSAGMLLGLRIHENQYWTPLVDVTKLADMPQDAEYSYWPVGMMDDVLMTILCKGVDRYPYFPRPAMTEVTLRLPLLSQDRRTVTLEETWLRTSILAAHTAGEISGRSTNMINDDENKNDSEESSAVILQRKHIEMDKLILQLIQMYCKSERLQKALDSFLLLTLSRSMDAAIKIAMFNQLRGLAEKMSRAKEKILYEQAGNATETYTTRMIEEYPSEEISTRVSNMLPNVDKDFSKIYGDSERTINHKSHNLFEMRNTEEMENEQEIPDNTIHRTQTSITENSRASSSGNPFAVPRGQLSHRNPFAAGSTTTTGKPSAVSVVTRNNSFFDAIQAIESEEDARNNRQLQKKNRAQSTIKKRRGTETVETVETMDKKAKTSAGVASLAQYGFRQNNDNTMTEQQQPEPLASTQELDNEGGISDTQDESQHLTR